MWSHQHVLEQLELLFELVTDDELPDAELPSSVGRLGPFEQSRAAAGLRALRPRGAQSGLFCANPKSFAEETASGERCDTGG